MKPGGRIDVKIHQWDVFGDWDTGKERLSDILNFLVATKRLSAL